MKEVNKYTVERMKSDRERRRGNEEETKKANDE